MKKRVILLLSVFCCLFIYGQKSYQYSAPKEIGDGFTLSRTPGLLALQPGLEAEDVSNSEIGIEYHSGGLRVKASVYKTEIDDVILDQLGAGPEPQDGVYYENVGTFEAEGFELNINYVWNDLEVAAAYSNATSELNGNTVEGYEHIGLANATGDTWNLSLEYMLSESIELGWNFIYVEDLDNIEVLQRGVELEWIDSTRRVDKPSYSVHDVYVHWTPLDDDSLKLSLAVQNLFDKRYRDHSSVADYTHISGWENVAGIYEAGRDVRLTVAYSF